MLDLMTLSMRRMTANDIMNVMAIELLVQKQPWHQGHFEASLKNKHDAWIAFTPDNALLGYFIQMPTIDVMELLLLAVSIPYQKQGVGTFLLKKAQSNSLTMNYQTMFLEVRLSNTPAISLYKKQGFIEVGRRKNYYRTSTKQYEDALLLSCDLQENRSCF